MLSGSEHLVAIPYDKCPGQGFKEKRAHLAASTVDAMKTLVTETGGFVLTMTADEEHIYVIPSGFITVVASNGCNALRWNISSDDQDCLRCKMMIEQVLTAFPEFRSETCAAYQLKDYL
jgi:hypothetical protein